MMGLKMRKLLYSNEVLRGRCLELTGELAETRARVDELEDQLVFFAAQLLGYMHATHQTADVAGR